jgi:hypothetical protein
LGEVLERVREIERAFRDRSDTGSVAKAFGGVVELRRLVAAINRDEEEC